MPSNAQCADWQVIRKLSAYEALAEVQCLVLLLLAAGAAAGDGGDDDEEDHIQNADRKGDRSSPKIT